MKKKQEDPNEAAYRIVQNVTGGEATKDPAAVALGRKGGLKGGKARAAALTAEQRKAIAKKGAEKRWGKKKD